MNSLFSYNTSLQKLFPKINIICSLFFILPIWNLDSVLQRDPPAQKLGGNGFAVSSKILSKINSD